MLSKQTLLRALKNRCWSASYDKENDYLYARLFEEGAMWDFKNLKSYFYMTGWKQHDTEEEVYRNCLSTIYHWYRGCHESYIDELSKPMRKEMERLGIM